MDKAKTGTLLLKERLKLIPSHAGVYRMLDKDGTVLYVGKAKNLKKRLENYTHPENLSPRIALMVSKVADLITIETASESEALLLEADLIKKYRPYFNILLKDDKSYPYLFLTNEEFPRLLKYRGNKTMKGEYFGPFADATIVNQTLKEIQKIFGLRTCTNSAFYNRTRPCLQYQIGRCSAPCTQCISKDAYLEQIKKTRLFLTGKTNTLQEEFKEKMNLFSQKQDYESAKIMRDKLTALNRIQSEQTKYFTEPTDIVVIQQKNDLVCIQVFFYRPIHNGGNAQYFFKTETSQEVPQIYENFLMQFYTTHQVPNLILSNLPVAENIQEALKTNAQKQIRFAASPFKGQRRILLEQAIQNATTALNEKEKNDLISDNLWEQLRQLLNRKELVKIEVYDNSHLQGTSAVGAMIAATKEGFQKNLYRRFNVQIENTKDDFAMMREVLTRRLKRGLANNDLPDAFFIDGGKGQLSAVKDVLDTFPNLPDITVMGIAKGKERNAGRETLFFLNNDTPLHLPWESPLLHLIQRLRDEAHRFAIGSHRIKRAKNMFHESLSDIEGIGAKRKKDLLNFFGSVKAISGASVAQLMKVNGINEKNAKKIYTFYHN